MPEKGVCCAKIALCWFAYSQFFKMVLIIRFLHGVVFCLVFPKVTSSENHRKCLPWSKGEGEKTIRRLFRCYRSHEQKFGIFWEYRLSKPPPVWNALSIKEVDDDFSKTFNRTFAELLETDPSLINNIFIFYFYVMFLFYFVIQITINW